MKEFAPNPSGPAHLGTLRTYAAAYSEAKKCGEPIFLRIDGWDYRDPECRYWPETFLQQLQELDLAPDHWQYCENPPTISRVPEWAVLLGNLKHLWACYPVTVDAVTIDDRPDMWQLVRVPPQRRIESQPQEFYHLTRFALWHQPSKCFVLGGVLASLLSMTLRGTKTIVRSYASTYLRQFCETYAANWFGFRLPDVMYTGYVIDSEGGLGKRRLEAENPGTVAWALNRVGAPHLRAAILKSVQEDTRAVIPYEDILL